MVFQSFDHVECYSRSAPCAPTVISTFVLLKTRSAATISFIFRTRSSNNQILVLFRNETEFDETIRGTTKTDCQNNRMLHRDEIRNAQPFVATTMRLIFFDINKRGIAWLLSITFPNMAHGQAFRNMTYQSVPNERARLSRNMFGQRFKLISWTLKYLTQRFNPETVL